MMGYWGGMDGSGWILMALFWLLTLGVVVWAIARVVPGRDDAGGRRRGDGAADAREVLDRRFAAGDIDAEDYRRRRDVLQSR